MKEAISATAVKESLRTLARAARDGMIPTARAAASARIADRAMAIVAAERPGTIAAYLPIKSEVDSRRIIERAEAQAIVVALPAVDDPITMVFRRYRSGDPLAAGGFGTLAPTRDQPMIKPDLIIVPLVAFDRAGGRLGHGRGFYDRALAALRGRGVLPGLVGVGFAVQEVPSIPTEPHDVPLDWIVTENETLDLRRNK